MTREPIELSLHSIGPKITLSVNISQLSVDERIELLMIVGDSFGLWSKLPTFASIEVDRACKQARKEGGGT